MKKKLVVAMLVGAMVLGTTACGGNNADASSQSSSVESSAESSTQESSTQESSSVAGDNTESAPDMEQGWSEEMSAAREAVVSELGDNYWPSMAMPAEILEGTYGVTSDMYVDFIGEIPMMSAHVDTLLIVKAAEGQEEAVEQALQAYRNDMVENSMQYPMNLGKVQASIVERMDSYVCLLVLGGDTMAAEEQGEEAVIKQCQEHNNKAMDAIAKSLGVERK